MPFKSEKQKRYLQINHPRIYKRWAKKYGKTVKGKTLLQRGSK